MEFDENVFRNQSDKYYSLKNQVETKYLNLLDQINIKRQDNCNKEIEWLTHSGVFGNISEDGKYVSYSPRKIQKYFFDAWLKNKLDNDHTKHLKAFKNCNKKYGEGLSETYLDINKEISLVENNYLSCIVPCNDTSSGLRNNLSTKLCYLNCYETSLKKKEEIYQNFDMNIKIQENDLNRY